MSGGYFNLAHIPHYLRLIRVDKPAGLILLLCPTILSVLLATADNHNYLLLVKFIFGGFLLRSAGCVINDMIDKKFDKRVARTKNRPLAAGVISTKEAMFVVALLLLFALIILLTLSRKTILLGFFTMIPVIAYPYMKRFSHFPQVFLGLTFNLGVIFAFVETHGSVTLTGWLLFFAMCLWTISYDTIYGFQDIQDDLKIGVKSTSIFFGEQAPLYIDFLNTFAILLLFLVGLRTQAGSGFLFCVGLAFVIFIWQKNRLDVNDPEICTKIFHSHTIVAIILIIAALNT